MITAFTGETLKFSTTVLDYNGDPVDLATASTMFSYKGQNNIVLTKPCTVSGNVLSAELLPSETLVEGIYTFEFRILINGEEDNLVQDNFELLGSLRTFSEV